jgi:hypothetical protein
VIVEALRRRLRRWRRPRGRVLAVKWGYNPNSSSLGVDVTFLLFGLVFVALATPLVGLLLRLGRRPAPATPDLPAPPPPTAGVEPPALEAP